MQSYIVLFTSAVLIALGSSVSAGYSPVAAAAFPNPAYVNGVPYNVAPFASSVNIVNRGLAAPYIASPYISSPYVASPYVARYAAPYAAPYVNAPYVAAPYTAAYTAAAPLVVAK